MDRRLGKVVVWLILVFVANQAPSSGQLRSVTITHKSDNKAEERTKQAGKLAKKLVGALPGILEQFESRRRKLADAGYPRAEVATLLDSTEASLQKEFKKPDFAPLRDHIADVFNQARSNLGLPTRTALLALPAPQVVLASLHFALVAGAPDSLDPGRAAPELNVVEAFIKDLLERARGKDLTIDLCIVSEPPKAKVSLHTASGRKIDPIKTNGRLENLFRGKYFYTVERRSFPKQEGPLDLYPKRQPVLDCDLDGMGCTVEEGWPEACRGR